MIPTVRGVGAVKFGTGAITVVPLVTHVSGDVELMFVETANEASTLDTAAGFAELTNLGQGTGGGTGATRMTVFWRRWNGSDGSPVVGDSGNHQIARIITFQDVVASGNPWDVFGSNNQTSVTTFGSVSGVTTTVADTLVVVATAQDLPDTNSTTEFALHANGNLSSVTEHIDNARNTGNGGAIGVAVGGLATAGASGATTFTSTTSSLKSNVCIALKPVVAAAADRVPRPVVSSRVAIQRASLY